MVTARGKKRSEGAIQLGKLGRTDEELAARLGCKREQVNYWKTAARVPGATNRARLRDELGIPVESWDQFPKGRAAASSSAPATPTSPPVTPIDYEVPPVIDDGTVRAKASRLDRLVRSMLDVIERDQTLTVPERFRMQTDAYRLLDKLGKLTGESAEMPESRIVRLPKFRSAVARILDAIEPYSDALAAAERVFAEMGGA